MHIKSITISNFRSFRQQGDIQPFSPHTNSVVGRNGSGKSNLFDAVQFCLGFSRFANLRQEERQALLHEGSGSAAVNAFVEIVFDNSDHRFQHENSDEVVLRRTIGLKKDEFFLQRKRTAKNEIQSLLEGAGFSKSNPYFIVQQGKVQDLCTMSDTARLRLLKEVAGTTVYDEKKAESLAKMEENNNSIAKIADMLQNIEDRLQELNAEKDELTEYQKLDRARRAAQYGLYTFELQKARNQLDAVEHDRAAHVETLAKLHETMKANHDAIRCQEAVLKTKTNALRRNRTTVQQLEEDKKQAVTVYTKLDLECKELEESVTAGDELVKSNQEKLERLEQEIAAAQKELTESVAPNYDQAAAALQGMNDERESAVKETEALYAKQGRGRMFRSMAERDEFLQQSSQELETAVAEKQTELAAQRDTLANLRRTVQQEAADIQSLQQEVTQKAATQQTMSKSVEEKKRQRLELHEARKNDWRAQEELQEQVREAREILHGALSDTKKVMPRATALGLEALKTVVEQEGLVHGEQYFGMVMENIQLTDDKYQTAVEVAAQNSLFHVIVDTDTTAAALMTRLEKDKLGRVTFLPLNQLNVEQVRYPDDSDVRPMLNDTVFTYDKKVDRAMKHVFSKKLMARSPEIASEWSVKSGMDVITLNGDLCSRKGAMTGGFVDVNKSRLRAYNKQIEAQEKLRMVEKEYQDMKRKAQQVDKSASQNMTELQRLEAKQAELQHMVTAKESELERLETRIANHKKQIETIEKTTIPPLERSIAALQGDIGRLQEEMGTELQQSLTDEDRERLAELKELQEKLATQIEGQQGQMDAAALAKQKLQSLLEDNLLKKRRELTDGVDEQNSGGGKRRQSYSGRLSTAALQQQRKEDLEDRKRERETAERAKEDLEERLESARQVEEDLRKELHASKNALEKLRTDDTKNSKAWEEAQDKAERFLTKRAMYTSKRENNMRKIQELGSLPPPAELKKYSGKSSSQLEKALDSINNKLKKYSHVNKKAYDQYVNFSDTRERLLKRKEELDHGAEKVQELIENLDQKKDEAINRTFRGVSSHFKEVFQELVPSGAGELIMRTAIDEEAADTDQEEEESSEDGSEASSPATAAKKKGKGKKNSNNPDVSLYRGVGIKVRFSEVGENFLMSQLSGGQKALVSLALIFAIQRCDPAPFYLFDELDQALDSTYRKAVAKVIQKQANSKESPTQFIVSTFRQELVAVANRCYGISHQNKVSNIHHMNKRDAEKFIADLMSTEEAVGEVKSVSAAVGPRASRAPSRKRKSSDKEEAENDDDDDDNAEEDKQETDQEEPDEEASASSAMAVDDV